MGTAGGRQSTDLITALSREPFPFDFFQAVRLLERHYAQSQDLDGAQRATIGGDGSPNREAVRFRAHQSHTFPGATIVKSKFAAGSSATPAPGKPDDPFCELTVTFMGLTGPSGVLPHHYTSLILERARAQDFSLRDYFDTFNHRTISLFYRAWEKYRFPFTYERVVHSTGGRETDTFTQALYSLTGLGTKGLRGRLEVDDQSFLLFGGLFSRKVPTAMGLERALAGFLKLPIRVSQFVGRWLYLSDEDRSSTSSEGFPLGRNMSLGEDVVVGERVWDRQSSIRLHIGPVGYRDFTSLMPGSPRFVALNQFARTFLGLEYDFDVQVILKKGEVPAIQLSDDSDSQLGWNTWLHSGTLDHDADDAVFEHSGNPELSTMSA